VDTNFFGEYKSGDNLVKLEQNDGIYKVIANGNTILETDEPKRAIARYYRSISNLIDAHTDDKDVALDLMGDQIVLNNRRAITALSMLGQPKEAEALKGFNLAYVTFPFDEEVFLKDSQFAVCNSAYTGGETSLSNSENNYEKFDGVMIPRKLGASKRNGDRFKGAIRLVAKQQTLGITPKIEDDYKDAPTRDLPTPTESKDKKIKPEKPIFWNMEDDITSGGAEGVGFRDMGRGSNNKVIKVKEKWRI
jgi:hypothetical protein